MKRKEQRETTVRSIELDYLGNESFTFNIFVSDLFVFSASLSIFINIFDIHFPLFFNPSKSSFSGHSLLRPLSVPALQLAGFQFSRP